MNWKFKVYEALKSPLNAPPEEAMRFVCFPYLPGGTDIMPVPFFGETALLAEALAAKFMDDEFAPTAVGKHGRIQ